MTEEFCTVTRKKWINKRSIQRRPRRISDRSYDSDCPDVDVDKFLKRLEDLCVQMKSCDYFTQAMQTIDEGLTELPPKRVIERLVCFGIGPFTRNFQALHQLAFILCAQRHYSITEAIYFDPILRDSEKQILGRLQCSLMAENCEAKYEADVLTMFYLPHCPNCLTNNLLWRNWRPANLQNLLLINNSFDSLSNSKPERWLRLDSGYILDVLPYAKEYAIDDDYETANVFNDLSVHIFPQRLLPAPEQKDFWVEREAPLYKDVGDMISAEDFNKLAIT